MCFYLSARRITSANNFQSYFYLLIFLRLKCTTFQIALFCTCKLLCLYSFCIGKYTKSLDLKKKSYPTLNEKERKKPTCFSRQTGAVLNAESKIKWHSLTQTTFVFVFTPRLCLTSRRAFRKRNLVSTWSFIYV